jgi:endonuclease YncB( thermonuclease family)
LSAMLRRLFLSVLLILPLSAEAETLTGKVVGVTDGDTIKVLVEERAIKVRLAEIDTPERGQPWASRAKQALSDKVFGEEVDVRVVNTDRYGRTVGHLWIGDRHINREMVREGHAWVYRQYLKDETLLDDETYAQKNEIGLWGLPESQRVPPWDWRRGRS